MRAAFSCEIVDREAVRFFFADVPEDHRAGVQLHLARCRRCRRKLQLFERLWTRQSESDARQAAG
jgi:hypothetical protein